MGGLGSGDDHVTSEPRPCIISALKTEHSLVYRPEDIRPEDRTLLYRDHSAGLFCNPTQRKPQRRFSMYGAYRRSARTRYHHQSRHHATLGSSSPR